MVLEAPQIERNGRAGIVFLLLRMLRWQETILYGSAMP